MFKRMNLQIFANGGDGSENSGEGNQGGQEQNNGQNNNQENTGNGENNNQNEQQNNVETFSKENYLKELGVDDEETFKEYIKNKKKEEEQNLTEIQKVQKTLAATTKELAIEKKARIQAEAKLQAIKDGAKPELVDDLVAIAMTKVSNQKTVEQVLAEMKKDSSRSFYYVQNGSGDSGNNNQNNGFTRGNAGNHNNNNQNNQDNGNNNSGSGSIAARLFARKNMGKTNNQGNK